MLEEVRYLPCGLKISREQFFLIITELEKSKSRYKYAYYNPHIIQLTECVDLFEIIRKVENDRKLTHQHEDKQLGDKLV